MTHEAAIEIDVIEHPKSGKRYISVDAIVNLMESIAHPMDPGPGKNGLLKIADSLRPISSYSHADPSPSTPKIKARRCECKAVVVDLLRMSGKPITVDVYPVPDGQWIVIDGQNGRTVVAPWNNTLEGNHVRLSEHTCTMAGN